MLKVPSGFIAGLALLYLGFYVLPSAMLAGEVVDSPTECQADLISAAEQGARGEQTDRGASSACEQVAAYAQIARAVLRSQPQPASP